VKIVHLIDSLGRAGAEQALLNLLPALQRRGHQCEVGVLMRPYDLAEDLEKAGIAIHRLDLSHRWNLKQGFTRVTALCRQHQYDVVHAHLFFAGFYTATSQPLAPAPRRVVSFHNLGYDSYPATTPWKKFRKGLDGWLMRHYIDGWVGVSRAAAEHYKANLGLSDIVVIPNAFPVDTLCPTPDLDRDAVLSQYGASSKDFVIVLPGRLVHEKGHRYLFQALELLREKNLYPKVLIFGDGPLALQIAEDVANKNLQAQVTLHQAVLHQELLLVIQTADAVVMASTHEGFGLAVAEAMALERPVLATRVGGMTDLVEDGVSGLLVSPAEPVALAEGIVRLMGDSGLREQLGKAARQRIETYFSADILATKWEQYYENLIKQRL